MIDRTRLICLLAAAVLCVVFWGLVAFAAASSAHQVAPHHCSRHHHRRQCIGRAVHRRRHHHRRRPAPAPASAPAAPPASRAPAPARHAPYVAATDEQQCGMPGFDMPAFLAAHHANVYRLVVQPWMIQWPGRDEHCAAEARAAGAKVYVSLAYGPPDPEKVAGEIAQTISELGPVWAFSIGNEPDLGANNQSIPQYLDVWNVAEPELAADDPGALRVLADAGPWAMVGRDWLLTLMAKHPEGAQIAAVHCYATTRGGLDAIPALSTVAAHDGYPLWCSEMAPDLNQATGPAWVHGQTAASWQANVQQIVNASPDLQMTAYYRWPQIGAD